MTLDNPSGILQAMRWIVKRAWPVLLVALAACPRDANYSVDTSETGRQEGRSILGFFYHTTEYSPVTRRPTSGKSNVECPESRCAPCSANRWRSGSGGAQRSELTRGRRRRAITTVAMCTSSWTVQWANPGLSIGWVESSSVHEAASGSGTTMRSSRWSVPGMARRVNYGLPPYDSTQWCRSQPGEVHPIREWRPDPRADCQASANFTPA